MITAKAMETSMEQQAHTPRTTLTTTKITELTGNRKLSTYSVRRVEKQITTRQTFL